MQRRLTIEELLGESGWLRTLAGHLVADASRADDLVQDTWLAALRRPPDATTPTRPWLARVLRNRATNARRAEERRTRHEGSVEERGEPRTPASAAEQAEAQRLLAEEIVRLAEELRTVVVLRYFRGLDSAAIAQELGVPAGTVRWRLAKALDELRAALDRRSGGERKAWATVLARVARSSRAERWTALSGTGSLVLAALLCLALSLGGFSLWRTFGADPVRTEPATAAKGAASQGVAVLSAATPAVSVPAMRETGGPAANPPAANEATGLEISGVVRVNGQPPERPLHLYLHETHRSPAVPADSSSTEFASMTAVPTQLIPVEAHGAFRFTGLAEGYRGRLHAPSYRLPGGDSELPVSAPATELVLELVPGPALCGTLVGPTGEPLGADLVVTVLYTGGEEQDPAAAGSVFDFDDFETEAGGYFCREVMKLEVPRASGLLLFELDQGYRALELPTFDVAVGLDLGTVQLEPVRSLRVRAVDAEGAPVRGAAARVVSRLTSSRASKPSDAEGLALLPFAPARPFELRVDALQYAAARVAVVDEDEVVVTLQRAPTVALRILAAPEVELWFCYVVVQGPPELVPWLTPWYANWLEGALRMQLGGSVLPQFEETWSGKQRHRLKEGGRVFLEGFAPGVPFSFELQDEQGRALATRTSVLGPGEWQELEIDLTH
jgi:RNA polymerase sigma-70 factor (ECF subfamily)